MPTPPFFPRHQQPPFTSKNIHHVVPLIPKRCTQNSSQTIPKTTPFCPKNSTSFISKTAPLYIQKSTETTMKTPQNGVKNAPSTAAAAVAPPSSTVFIVVACCRLLHLRQPRPPCFETAPTLPPLCHVYSKP